MQPLRRSATALSSFVADAVPERVVDALEVIEVEAEHAIWLPRWTRASACSSRSAQQHAVGQVGERVVVRHVGDLRFSPALAT